MRTLALPSLGPHAHGSWCIGCVHLSNHQCLTTHAHRCAWPQHQHCVNNHHNTGIYSGIVQEPDMMQAEERYRKGRQYMVQVRQYRQRKEGQQTKKVEPGKREQPPEAVQHALIALKWASKAQHTNLPIYTCMCSHPTLSPKKTPPVQPPDTSHQRSARQHRVNAEWH